MDILAIGAHPDDLEIYCYGTLAKYAKLGHRVYMCSVANGNLGHKEILPDELAQMRRTEAKRSAQLIGAVHMDLDIDDLRVNSNNAAQQEKLVEVIRIAQPDVIITHCPDDYMPDHCETSKLVFYASFASSVPNYTTQTPCFDPVVPIYYMEAAGGMGFVPEEYVDISDYLDMKLEAIRCHRSQAQWLDDHDGFNMEEYANVSGRYRGIQCGRQYAEGFRKCNVWPRARSQRLLP